MIPSSRHIILRWLAHHDHVTAAPIDTTCAMLPGEVRRLLRGDLDAARAVELLDQMRAAGLPT